MAHLTLDERIRIQEGLDSGLSIRNIARIIDKSPSTVLREINSRKCLKGKRYAGALPPCVNKNDCTIYGLCPDTRCHKPCRNCLSCKTVCKHYIPAECERLRHSPYVCNGCTKYNICTYERIMYFATYAHNSYQHTLISAREGINQDPETVQNLDHLISPLLRKGQSIAHIYANHKNEIPCCKATLYNYIDASLFTACNMDLPRKVKYKVRKIKKTGKLSTETRMSILSRNYIRFNEYVTQHPDLEIVEMDTVVGPVGSKKCLLTMLFRSCNLMLAFLLPEKTQDCVIETLNVFCRVLGIEEYKKLFPVVLTDRGLEFSFPEALECDENGEIRSKIFYCDPQCAWQKGALERNHELIRYVIPKGKSFDFLTQKEITLLVNHINSLSREKYHGKTPYELSRFMLNNKLHDVLELKKIEPDEVTLKPSLLK